MMETKTAGIKKSLNTHSGSTININFTDFIISQYKGKCIFPCMAKGKAPDGKLAPKGFHAASKNIEQIKKWWTQRPDDNVGVVTGAINDIWVLDVDDNTATWDGTGKHKTGLQTLADLELEHGQLITKMVRTGAGGIHYYFKYHAGIKNKANIFKDVDIRGDGGYVIAPPSIHATGNVYECLNDLEPQAAPEWLIALITKEKKREITKEVKTNTTKEKKKVITKDKTDKKVKPYVRKALQNQCANVRKAPEGQRNATLNDAACQIGNYIAGGEISEADAQTELFLAAIDAGLKTEEIKKTIKSGFEAGFKTPKTAPKTQSTSDISDERINAKNWKSDDYVEFLKTKGYTFKLNTLLDTVEVNGKQISDISEASFLTTLDDSLKNKRGEGKIRNVVLSEAAKNSYHPLQSYFKSLKTENTAGSIDKLIGYFKTNNDDLFKIYLKKWLVNAVARAFSGCENTTLVLDGAQGCGKSYFTKWIAPLNDFFYEGSIHPDNKDDLIRLISFFVWEVSELGATTRKADREALKQFQTIKWVVVRKPYDRYSIEKPPMANFIGTINNEAGFLNDPTGNRRYNVITVKNIDWKYSTEIDIQAVWAEAYQLYIAGYEYLLTKEEKALRDNMNSYYNYRTHIDEMLDAYITITDDENDFLPSLFITRALKAMGCKDADNKIQKNISDWMRRSGRVTKTKNRDKGRRWRVYEGINHSFPEYISDSTEFLDD